MFTKFRSVLGQKHIHNEALARCFINLVVFSCILEERSIIQNSKIRPISFSPIIPTPTPPAHSSSEKTEPVAIGLYFETELKQKTIYEGKTVLLSGLADYSLGYRQGGASSGNLVIVKAKIRYRIGNAYGQLLSYMGSFALLHSTFIRLTSKGRNDSHSLEKIGEEECCSLWSSN